MSRGQALVEAALIIPIMLAVMLATLQFGVFLWGESMLTRYVSEAIADADPEAYLAGRGSIPLCEAPLTVTVERDTAGNVTRVQASCEQPRLSALLPIAEHLSVRAEARQKEPTP